MSTDEIWKIAGAVLAALGGGGAIVVALSGWLGKLWAERFMAKERNKYEQELTELRANLERVNKESIATLQTGLEIYRDTRLKGLADKLAIYRETIDIIANFIADIDLGSRNATLNHDPLDVYNRGRMKAFGYLAMLAPHDVMESYLALTDYLLNVVKNLEKYDWERVRTLSRDLANKVRKDIGIAEAEIDFSKIP